MGQSNPYHHEEPYSDAPVTSTHTVLSSNVSDQIHSAVQSLARRGQQLADSVQDAASGIKPALDQSLKEKPLTTLAAAVVVGFAIGALWKS